MKNSVKAKVRWLGVAVAAAALCGSLWAQPRRMENPETIQLPAGARVEFDTFSSESMGESVDYSVFLPPSYDKAPERRFPAVYFLHGLFNDHTSWAVERYGNIPERLAQLMLDGTLPEFLIINPSGGRGFYTDTHDGSVHYERAIYEDVIKAAEERYRLRSERSARALGGTSMGGYGALKIAFRQPQLFSAVAAGSPIVLLGDDPLASIPDDEGRLSQYLRRLVGGLYGSPVNTEHWLANSLEKLAQEASLDDGLGIYFFYGTADRYGQALPLEEGVRKLHQILDQRGIEHRFEIIEQGPHGWDLVVQKLDDMFAFLSRSFRQVD
ncbi:MAG TPA: alpha/beta hydrolase-fold protein [Acidobacteriota bacterium]|nr:alpha/beta hydrolase-fold protein [Acidobacteriota bacterium]